MSRNLSDHEIHAMYCPVKNSKSALFLVAYFSVAAFVNWRGLRKPPEHSGWVELLFAIFVVALLVKWLVNFTCFRERLVFGLAIVILVAGQVEGFLLSPFSQYVEIVISGHLALSLLGLLVSLSMLVQSAVGWVARTQISGTNLANTHVAGRQFLRFRTVGWPGRSGAPFQNEDPLFTHNSKQYGE